MPTVPFDRLIAQWPDPAISLITSWSTVEEPLEFLRGVHVDDAPVVRSPLTVLRDRVATPLDGALLLCAALRALGHPPRLLVLFSVDLGLAAAAIWQDGDLLAYAAHNEARRGATRGLAGMEAVVSALCTEVGETEGRSLPWTVVDLESLDAQDWMGDDGQLGGLLAAIEAGLEVA